MDRDDYADMFRFQIGQCVRWAEFPNEPHYIGQRRWTQREILAPVVQYRLHYSSKTGSMMGWVAENDIEVWEE